MNTAQMTCENKIKNLACVTGVIHERRECRAKEVVKGIITENFPNLAKGMHLQIRKAE